jgi:hypothetical protein
LARELSKKVETEPRARTELLLRTGLGVLPPLLTVWTLITIYEAVFNVTVDRRLDLLLLGVALILGIYAGIKISSENRLVRAVVFIFKNLWLWVFGNVNERETLNEIHNTTAALHESLFFGRLANLRSLGSNYYHIVYTHKGPREHAFGDLQNYRIAGFPYDEAEIIMLLWYLVASNLNLGWSEIRTICSCSANQGELHDRIVRSSFSLVGSSKANYFTSRLMDEILSLEKEHLIERTHIYTMQTDQNGDCYLRDAKGKDLVPDLTNPSNPDEKKTMKDYALLMKLPNILGPRKVDLDDTILLFAGCRVAGQVALTKWVGDPVNLAILSREYSSRFFQVILEVKYNFIPQGIPKIVSTSILTMESIEVKSS